MVHLRWFLKAKSSNAFDDVARRGRDEDSSKATTTLSSPNLLSRPARLARLLRRGLLGVRGFTTKHEGNFELDLSRIRRAVCVSVTLDSFPATSLSWQKLVKSGLVPADGRPAINLSLADLYGRASSAGLASKTNPFTFWRRIEWESKVEYLADEEDLLVYYLSEGLAIPRSETGSEPPTMILRGSEELRRYYMAEWIGAEQLPTSQTYFDPLVVISNPTTGIGNAFGNCWDAACVLLDLSFERQQEFERQFQNAVETVQREGND